MPLTSQKPSYPLLTQIYTESFDEIIYSKEQQDTKKGDKVKEIKIDRTGGNHVGSSSLESTKKRVERFHRLLRDGHSCQLSSVDDIILTQVPPAAKSALDIVQRLLNTYDYASMIEISKQTSRSSLSQYFAEKHYRGLGGYETRFRTEPIASEGSS